MFVLSSASVGVVDDRGRANGVQYFDRLTKEERQVSARIVVVAAARHLIPALTPDAEAGEIAGYGCATWLGFRVPRETSLLLAHQGGVGPEWPLSI